jgi:hypothetical protein
MFDFAQKHRAAVRFMELHHHAPYIDDESRACEMRVLGAAAAFFEETRRQQVTKDVPSGVLIAIVYGAFTALMKGCWSGHLELTPEVLDAAEGCIWEAIRR